MRTTSIGLAPGSGLALLCEESLFKGWAEYLKIYKARHLLQWVAHC